MKSILVHVHEDDGLESRLQAAFDLARCFGGHITCLHASPLRHYLVLDPVAAADLPQEFSWKIEQNRGALQSRMENRFVAEGVQWEWIQVNDVTSNLLVSQSILADVIVLNTDGSTPQKRKPRPIGAAVAVRARAAVLAVPNSSRGVRLTAPILIAWNGSPEAAAALRSALPILRISEEVHLLQVEETMFPYPKDMAARYLARHGIEAEVIQGAPMSGSVTEAIRSTAVEIGAGMIVMGAYGRPRLQETIFGGVTRELLAESLVPLLLAH